MRVVEAKFFHSRTVAPIVKAQPMPSKIIFFSDVCHILTAYLKKSSISIDKPMEYVRPVVGAEFQ